MPPRRTRFNQDQYALLRRCSESMDFTEWNRWYAEYLADNLFLRSTDSYGAHLAGAELSGANPDAAVYDPAGRIKFDPDHASRLREAAESGNIGAWNAWYKTELSQADGDVRLYGAYLEEASLRNLDLSGAVLCYAHLEGADLWQANLTGADLRYAELGGANLAGAKKEKALF